MGVISGNNNINTKSVNPIVKSIQGLMGLNYRRTYFSPNDNKVALDTLRKNFDKSIDNLMDKNIDLAGGTNVSKLYSRLQQLNKIQNDSDVVKSIEDLFGDKSAMDSILSTYMDNKYILDYDLEIDTICKYMPQLVEALEAKKDNVLSADDFSKDFINVNSLSKIGTDNQLNNNISELKREYNILELIENIYDNASKYGEQFVYVVPYSKALSNLLVNKDKLNNSGKTVIKMESGGLTQLGSDPSIINKDIKIDGMELEITLSESKIIESVVNEAKSSKSGKQKLDVTIDPDKLEFDKFNDIDKTSSDGLIDEEKQKKIDVPGCIVRRLRRENVIPIYINELCLGYYYIETEKSDPFDYVESIHDPIAGLKRNLARKESENIKNDEMLKQLSAEISKKIDAKFINANQDLRKEIYVILKHNELTNDNVNKINITFIPPEDIFHFYFKKDDKTNRGISDLNRGLLAAKLYASLYISNTIGVITRGQDKRAYFVKQFVDTNISQTLLNTINQIKKSNFGMREINNLNNILNITGRYNDYVIPVSQNGDKPIEFEVIPGQDIDAKTDLMETLERIAVNSTDVPKDIIDASTQVDYATRLVMTNSKFLRHVIKRQTKFQDMISRLITKIYNCHFGKDDLLEVLLPPPSHLNLTNMFDLYSNADQLSNGIVDTEFGQANDDQVVKDIFKKKLMRYYLSTFINWATIDKLKAQSEVEGSVTTNNKDEGE